MRQCLLLWVASAVCLGAFASAAAVPKPDAAREVQLYLLADYAPGFPLTVSAPELMAQPVSSQHVNCQQQLCMPCLQQQAVVMSQTMQLLSSPGASKSLPTAAKCTSSQALVPGVYSLQAGAVEGSAEATWSCYQHHSNGSATEMQLIHGSLSTQHIAESRLLASISSNSGSRGAASPVSAVELQPGNQYTCVAFYTPAVPAASHSAATTTPAVVPPTPTAAAALPQTVAAAAADSSNSDKQVVAPAETVAIPPEGSLAVAPAVTPAVAANNSQPSRANQAAAAAPANITALPALVTAANATNDAEVAGAVNATQGLVLANTTATEVLAVPAATVVLGADTTVVPGVAVPAAASPAEMPAADNQTVTAAQAAPGSTSTVADNSSAMTTDTMTFSTTDMTTDQTNTTTVTFDPVTGEILETETDTGASPQCTPPAYKQPPRGQPAPPLATAGSRIINTKTRRPIYIKGINWFGFNVDLGMLNGLWAGGSDAATDFSKIAYQLSQLGFNAVRLPFAHNYLAKTDVWDAVRPCTMTTERDLKMRLVDPQDISYRTMTQELPDHPAPMRNKDKGNCNTYLPARSNTDRLLFVIQQFVALGMYVVLDYQPQGLEDHAYDLSQFVGAWKSLWQKVTCLPNFKSDIAGRVLIDVMNEPDSMGIRWEAQGDRPGAEQLYLATADALWRMSPKKMLFMFEGTGQNMYGLNWGNGFITDKDVVKSGGLSDPTTFFQRLSKKPYVKSAVISSHLYPPSITKSTWLGEDLWKQSNTSFAYLQYRGFCDAGSCTRFPILIGETGSALDKEDDSVWLEDFADFVMARGAARAYNHQPLAGWMWWAYNENSGDTGGIVMNNWQDLNWVKLRYMIDNLGLQPWYKQPASSVRRRNSANSRAGTNSVGGQSGANRAGRRGRASSRRPHRRQGGHQAVPKQQQYVAPSWEELGFDIGTLPMNS